MIQRQRHKAAKRKRETKEVMMTAALILFFLILSPMRLVVCASKLLVHPCSTVTWIRNWWIFIRFSILPQSWAWPFPWGTLPPSPRPRSPSSISVSMWPVLSIYLLVGGALNSHLIGTDSFDLLVAATAPYNNLLKVNIVLSRAHCLPCLPWRWAPPPNPFFWSRRNPFFLSRALCAHAFRLANTLLDLFLAKIVFLHQAVHDIC